MSKRKKPVSSKTKKRKKPNRIAGFFKSQLDVERLAFDEGCAKIEEHEVQAAGRQRGAGAGTYRKSALQPAHLHDAGLVRHLVNFGAAGHGGVAPAPAPGGAPGHGGTPPGAVGGHPGGGGWWGWPHAWWWCGGWCAHGGGEWWWW